MASGNTLVVFTPLHNQPPASNFALLGTRNANPTLEYDDTTNWDGVFGGVLPRNYAAGGVTITLVWAAKTAATGNVLWLASFERLQDGVDNIGNDSFAATQTSSADTAPGSSGIVKYSTIAFTNGAQMDNLALGEAFRLKVTRNAASGSDTMVGNAQLVRVEIKET